MDISQVVKVVMEQIKETVRSETVVGKPVQAEDSVIVPVSRVAFGFGVGGGENNETAKSGGTATAGGATIEPVAFVVVSKGKAQLLPLKSREATLSRVIDIVPSILDLFKDSKAKDDEKDDEKKAKEKTESK
ncbi:GerW family sporulation protein [Candidatus Latescibacterota bacterium]